MVSGFECACGVWAAQLELERGQSFSNGLLAGHEMRARKVHDSVRQLTDIC